VRSDPSIYLSTMHRHEMIKMISAQDCLVIDNIVCCDIILSKYHRCLVNIAMLRYNTMVFRAKALTGL